MGFVLSGFEDSSQAEVVANRRENSYCRTLADESGTNDAVVRRVTNAQETVAVGTYTSNKKLILKKFVF